MNPVVYVAHDDIERAIRIFRKSVQCSGLLRELKEKSHFLSKGEKRKLKSMRARMRLKKKRIRRERYERI